MYIGETGDLPPKRWAAHLAPDGTLCGKLADIGMELSDYDEEFVFVGICCDEIRGVDPPLRKLARRAIEEELHRRFSLDPARIHPEATLLSSMPKAPVRITLPFDPRLAAEEAYGLIAETIKQCVARAPMTQER